jgi:hypothetical protein
MGYSFRFSLRRRNQPHYFPRRCFRLRQQPLSRSVIAPRLFLLLFQVREPRPRLVACFP